MRKIGNFARQFNVPWGVKYLNDNEILIANRESNRIQQVNVQTGTAVKTFSGELDEAKGELSNPIDVCPDEQHRIVETEYGTDIIIGYRS